MLLLQFTDDTAPARRVSCSCKTIEQAEDKQRSDGGGEAQRDKDGNARKQALPQKHQRHIEPINQRPDSNTPKDSSQVYTKNRQRSQRSSKA